MQGPEVDVESRHVVRSSDEVVLEIPVAGPVSRIAAYGIDAVLILLLEVAAVMAAVALGAMTTAAASQWPAWASEVLTADDGLGLAWLLMLVIVVQLVVEMVYFVGWELLATGQSPGKRLFGLRVVRDGGVPLTAWASLVRNVLRAVDQLPAGYVVGLVSMLLSPDGKRLGDVAGRTIVARVHRPGRATPLPAIDPGRVDAVRITSAQVAMLDADAARLARGTLRRLASLDDERRAAVLAVATRSIAQRLTMTEPFADGEAFLHAVVRAYDDARR